MSVDATLQVTDYASLVRAADTERERVELTAEWIGDVFDRFYDEFLKLTWMAKTAFEDRDPPASVAHAKKRLGLYNATVYPLADELRSAYPGLAESESLWGQVEAALMPSVHGTYEADLALAYLHSVRRRLCQGDWKPVEYAFGEHQAIARSREAVYETFACSWPVESRVVQRILQVAELAVPFVDAALDATRIARRLNEVLAAKAGAGLYAIEMVRAGFFRNRGAYLVGRLVLERNEYKPFVIALVNNANGVRGRGGAAHDAARPQSLQLHGGAVPGHQPPVSRTQRFPPQHHADAAARAALFNHRISPRQQGGGHERDPAAARPPARIARHAPGWPGTVAMAFTSPRSAYILKVIRDRPTAGYKWDSFEGVEAVMNKYRRVHEINRTGSMLDNILYYNLKLDRAWFAPGLLQELSAPPATRCGCRMMRWCSDIWWCSESLRR